MNVPFSDCSSFVQTVFEQAGSPNYFGRGKAQTGAMRAVIKAKGGGYTKTPKLGDIVMWQKGSTGHVGIIAEVCPGGKAKLIAMGSKGPAPTRCLTWQEMTRYGLGGAAGFLGFWTVK